MADKPAAAAIAINDAATSGERGRERRDGPDEKAMLAVPLSLTTREREILKLVAKGKGTKEIAATLCISPDTVADHRKHICRKLNVHSTASLVAEAISILSISGC